MEVKKLWIYPVKSMRGISLDASIAEPEGFQYDRRWMLIDEMGKFITQREFPELTQFVTKISLRNLLLRYNGSDIAVPISQDNSPKVEVQLWKSTFLATLAGTRINEWLSEMLGKNIRMVTLGAMDVRTKFLVKSPWRVSVSLADGYPYSIIGTASLEYLNSRAGTDIDYRRFRPNIIIETTIPHDEDSWSKIKIGEAIFSIIKPAKRCQVIGIDQISGEKSQEPIKTLSQYRKRENAIEFATYAVLVNEGVVSLGDKAEAIKE